MADQQDTQIDLINAPSRPWGDLYHHMLRGSWWATLAGIAGLIMLVNVAFAVAFHFVGGIGKARPDSFADAFFFSVQTLGTIGYGEMFPQSTGAEILVTLESIAAIIVSAVSTGIIFAKFSMPKARLSFTHHAAVFTMDGERTLAFRIANERRNYVVEATIKVSFMHLEHSPEGLKFYRMYDLAMVRERTPALGRSWMVMHKIDPKSPLHAKSSEALRGEEVELVCSVMGIDSTSGQTIHAQYRYDWETIQFGKRHADLLREKEGGRLELDYAKFHDMVDARLD